MSARILIVEDEPWDFNLLKGAFEETEYDVEWARTGEDGLLFVRHNPIDGAIVDLHLKNAKHGGMSFIKICRDEGRHFPAVIVTNTSIKTAKKVTERFRPGGSPLDHADDYVQKEPGTDWLWIVHDKLSNKITPRWMMDWPPYRLDGKNHIFYIDGQPLKLRPSEFRVLECIMYRAGTFVENLEIYRLTHDDVDPDEVHAKAAIETIQQHIAQLRKKIGARVAIDPIETDGNRYGWRVTEKTEARPSVFRVRDSLRVGRYQLEAEPKYLVVLGRDTRSIQLEPLEFEILKYLMNCAGAVRSRARIHERVYGSADTTPLTELDQVLWSLKRKTDGPDDEPIKYIGGTGCFYFSSTGDSAEERRFSDS